MSKILVISDLHLTRRFDRQKFEVLYKLIEQCDQLIVNGDLYEEHAMSFDEFCHSRWSELFPLMRHKQAVCVIGNHDTGLAKEVWRRCCTAVCERYEVESGGQTFVFLHGHNFGEDATEPSKAPKPVRRLVSELLRFLCFNQEHLVIYRFLNRRIKAWKKANLPMSTWLITGHTHLVEVDEGVRYANSGLILSARIYSYLWIEDGVVTMRRGQ